MKKPPAPRFAVGDHVTWNSEAGRVTGRIIAIHEQDFPVHGYTHRARKTRNTPSKATKVAMWLTIRAVSCVSLREDRRADRPGVTEEAADMKRNRTGLPRLVDSAAENLAPAYFALVMATGAVSLAAQAVDYSFLARSLFWLNGIFYVVLWFLTAWRMLRFGRRMGVDFKDYQRGPGFFSVVAGSAILGTQFVLLANEEKKGMLLWGLAMALWLILNYGIFTAFTIRKHKPSLDEGITGT
ncbi:C4-dicarboxylate transporter/malic acid transport protein, putative, partial [Acidithiobacillus sp. GGI-221]